MAIQINQITPYEEDEKDEKFVQIKTYFSGDIAGINLNGNIVFEEDEFQGFIDGEKMKAALKQKVIEKIMGGETPAE